ncbi:MAG: helix-turn-helix domain-containing protein [Pseudonocardiaceae bacterium]
MATKQDSSIRRRYLGDELRRLREQAKKKLEDIATYMGCSPAKISRIEKGHVAASASDVRDMLEYYGVPRTERDRYVALARQPPLPGWWCLYGDLVEKDEWFREYGPLEDQASTLKSFETMLIPGLLQTEAYVRALFAVGPNLAAPQAVLDRGVQFRIERQAILSRENPPSYIAVIDEAALRRQVGTAETMRAQLQHLINSTELVNVTIEVVSFSSGAYVGQDGAFTILGFTEPSNSDVVYVQSPVGNLYLEKSEQVQHQVDTFNHIRKAALSKQESIKFIRAVMADLL